MSGKLNERQIAKLKRLSIGGEYHSGVTGLSLVRRGLAEKNSFGCFIITPAGLQALRDQGQ